MQTLLPLSVADTQAVSSVSIDLMIPKHLKCIWFKILNVFIKVTAGALHVALRAEIITPIILHRFAAFLFYLCLY